MICMPFTCHFPHHFLIGLNAATSTVSWGNICLDKSQNFLKLFTKAITDKQCRLLEMAEKHYKRAHKSPRLHPVNVTLTNPAKHCLDVFCFHWQYLVYMDHSKGNNHSSRVKRKHKGKWTVYFSVNCFAVSESGTYTFVGLGTKQMTLQAATSMVMRFAVSRAMLKTEKL
jgi:hypothetical protein